MATVGDVAVADSAVALVRVADVATPAIALPINLFSLNQSDVETDISGFYCGPDYAGSTGQGPFTHQGVTIQRDTSQAWHGKSSLKVTMDGGYTFEPITAYILAPGRYVAGGIYEYSAYLYSAAGGPVLRFYCQADTGSIGTVGNITLAAGWNRYSFSATLPNPITQAWIGIRIDTGSTAQAFTMWMDGLQCETGSVANAWQPGSLGAGVVAIGDMRAP